MTSARFRFTPSMLDGETLEKLFVARQGLLTSAVTAVRDAGTGEHRAHKLFVGPRGAGKTHLIALVHHRVLALRAEGLRVQAAWLVEDPWDIGSYEEFLDAVLDSRTNGPPRTGGDPETELLASVADGGPLVVLAENFDRILTAIGADGRRRLRALLENSRPLLLVATATRLSDAVARQDEPFYGFFSVTHLEPFGVEDAAAMLIALAKHEQNAAQVELLERPEAARRLATIAHLAGGQPRVWALLGPALQTSGIEDLVQNLLARVDDLTPYYQEQLGHLSPQEARVVRRMAAHDRPLTVRGIAALAKLDQRSVSKTISDLRRRGWIKQYSSAITDLADKRHSYYVLAEPLARLAFQVKESHGEPIQLVVEFIAAWHDVSRLSAGHDVVEYIRRANELAVQSSLARSLAGDRAARDNVTGTGSRSADPPHERMLVDLDDALVELQERHDPSSMLNLPAPVIEVVDAGLSSEISVETIRLEIAGLATVWGLEWRSRLVSAGNDVRALAIEVSQEFLFGTPATVRVLVHNLMTLAGNRPSYLLDLQLMLGVTELEAGNEELGFELMDEAVENQIATLGKDHPRAASNRRMRDSLRDASHRAASQRLH